MSVDIQRAYGSVHYRAWFIKGLRHKRREGWLFQKANIRYDERFPHITWDFKFQNEVRASMIYFRKSTRTVVAKISLGNADGNCAVVKIFQTHEPATRVGSESKFLASHEIEMRCLHLFSSLVAAHVTPHITLPVCATPLLPHQVAPLLDGFPDHVIKTMSNEGKYMLMIAEYANHQAVTQLVYKKLKTLKRKHASYIMKCIIYQVVYTLACIHLRLPSFRHNDLHTSNVLLNLIDIDLVSALRPDEFQYVRYCDETGHHVFIDLVACPYRVMLWDFFFSSIRPEDAERLAIDPCTPRSSRLGRRGPKGSKSDVNQYFDMNKFLDTLWGILKDSKQWDRMDDSIKQFFKDVMPDKYRCSSIGRQHRYRTEAKLFAVNHTTARDLLRHPVFNSLRIPFPTTSAPLAEYDQRRGLDMPERGKGTCFPPCKDLGV